MATNIEITSKLYTFMDEYVNSKGEIKTATVKLVVNQSYKTFEVLPGDHNNAFTFSSRGKADFAKWSVVGKLIYMATEFAIKDLELKIIKPEDLKSNETETSSD